MSMYVCVCLCVCECVHICLSVSVCVRLNSGGETMQGNKLKIYYYLSVNRGPLF